MGATLSWRIHHAATILHADPAGSDPGLHGSLGLVARLRGLCGARGAQYRKLSDGDGPGGHCVELGAIATPDQDLCECLHDVTLSFVPGKLHIVAGGVGAGKSALILALLGELHLTKGRVQMPALVSITTQVFCRFDLILLFLILPQLLIFLFP